MRRIGAIDRDKTKVTAQALRRLAFTALAVLLAACGGSVGPSPNVVDPLVITVQPATATIYPGVATTILITGGTGSYVVVSDNQATVPIATAAVGHALTVIANPVTAETVVTLTVRDTGTTPQKTVTLTVRPGTIANAVTITPSSSECAPTLCSGGDALVAATISQAGIPLPARSVRFEVVSGDIRFITTPAGTTPEVLATTQTTTSDQGGVARVRVRALPGVASQTALIQITDPETLAFIRVAIRITQFTGVGNAVFFSIPTSMTFTGPFIGQCASNVSAGVGIFGGTPPYNVLSTAPGTITVIPEVVPNNGGRFTVNIFGSACFTDVPITITDAAGRTISVTVTNQQGTTAAPAPAVTIAPANVVVDCGQTASFIVSGGTTPISGSVNNGNFVVTVAGRSVSVMRLGMPPALPPPPPPPPPPTITGTVTVTDGATSASATVTAPATCS